MELALKLVALLTALVGLYKAATLDPQMLRSAFRNSPLAPLLTMGVLVLGPLALLWAFTAIFSSMATMGTPPQSIRESPPELPRDATNSDLLLRAASAMPNTSPRSDALSTVVDFSLSNGDFRTATNAALLQPSSTAEEKDLWKIVGALTKAPATQPAVKAADTLKKAEITR